MNIQITKEEARRFILLKHGLVGDYKFYGKSGILDFVRQTGCIQYDPIDVCGKNPELVLQSRVSDFNKQMLYDLLYRERSLVDYFDKNLAIFATEDWEYFERYRAFYRTSNRSLPEIKAVCADIKQTIAKRGAVCSADLGYNEKVAWYWNSTKLSRAALEYMYFTGELAIHHKKGAIKYYDIIQNCIPSEILNKPDPHIDDFDYKKWHLLRRIGAVGLMWNRASDAWLNIEGLKAADRNIIFMQLLDEDNIFEVEVVGLKDKIYLLTEDRELLSYALKNEKLKERCEFLAPLDNILWDRRLIYALFDFDYKWEIYTPQEQRKFGYYVLPILYGEKLIGRIEMVCERKNKNLNVKNIWFEEGVIINKNLKEALNLQILSFAEFNECDSVDINPELNPKEEVNRSKYKD